MSLLYTGRTGDSITMRVSKVAEAFQKTLEFRKFDRLIYTKDIRMRYPAMCLLVGRSLEISVLFCTVVSLIYLYSRPWSRRRKDPIFRVAVNDEEKKILTYFV